MAPTPPNTTARCKVSYSGPFGSHTMLFHAQTAADMGDFVTGVQNVITTMAAAVWSAVSFTGAETAEAGSPFFFPVVGWSTITGTSGIAPSTPPDGPGIFEQFGGRGPDGVRVKLYLFEVTARPNLTMRIPDSATTTIEDIIDALQSSVNLIGTISGSAPVWKRYANIKTNDYLVQQARS